MSSIQGKPFDPTLYEALYLAEDQPKNDEPFETTPPNNVAPTEEDEEFLEEDSSLDDEILRRAEVELFHTFMVARKNRLNEGWQQEALGAQSAPIIPIALTQQGIEKLKQDLKDVFNNSCLEQLISHVEQTQDINAALEGWTLLHFCTYQFNYVTSSPFPDWQEDAQKLIEIIRNILAYGGDLTKEDSQGRTPIYFASGSCQDRTQFDQEYWKLLSASPQSLNTENGAVQPLHVAVSLMKKCVIDMLDRGANPDALDMYGRTPMHCAAIHARDEIYNLRPLLGFSPSSLELADAFGFFPLTYAAIFAEDNVFDFISNVSPRWVVLKVMEQLDPIAMESDEETQALKEIYKIYDVVYNVPPNFKVYFGGAPPKQKKKENRTAKLGKIEKEKKPTYEKDGIKYDIYHDGHGSKHLISLKDYDEKYKNQNRKFAKNTKNGNSSVFFPKVFKDQSYESLVAQCVKTWVDKGADLEAPYVHLGKEIGADNGELTKFVQIYFTASGGAHIRPKALLKES